MDNMTLPDLIIAVDGYSSTGKSTLAKRLASEFGLMYLDSGAMYRCVTLFAQTRGIIDENSVIDEEALKEALPELEISFRLEEEKYTAYIGEECVETQIRSLAVSSQVSPVSALAFVREFVDKSLRRFGSNGRVVMDGRDIGTTVFPDAGIKIFLIANPEIRAKRRFDEMVAKGESPVLQDIVDNLSVRDYTDSHRKVSPLSRAADAYVFDNSFRSIEEEVIWVKGLVQGKFGIFE